MTNRFFRGLGVFLLLACPGCSRTKDPAEALKAEVEECQHTNRTAQIEALIAKGAPADFKLPNGRTPLCLNALSKAPKS